MTEETSEEISVADQLKEPAPPDVEASVWRLGSSGSVLASVSERHAGEMAGMEFPSAIYFYADLSDSQQTTHDEKTLHKVYRALADQGLSEAQIINAVNGMQNVGILFRERAV